MSWATSFKRSIVKEAETGNVINVTPEEEIESLNMQNLEGPHVLARRNILENIASAVDMPVKLLTQESFAEGFGEGSEDAKAVAAINGFDYPSAIPPGITLKLPEEVIKAQS